MDARYFMAGKIILAALITQEAAIEIMYRISHLGIKMAEFQSYISQIPTITTLRHGEAQRAVAIQQCRNIVLIPSFFRIRKTRDLSPFIP